MSIDSNTARVDERISVAKLFEGRKSPLSDLARQISTLLISQHVQAKYNLFDLESSLAMANFFEAYKAFKKNEGSCFLNHSHRFFIWLSS